MNSEKPSSLDHALGRMLGRGDRLVESTIALTSQALAQGHVCLPLFTSATRQAISELSGQSVSQNELSAALRSHPAVEVFSAFESRAAPSETGAPATDAAGPMGSFRAPRSVRPLVLDAAGRLYLARYHEHEQRLARSVVRLLRARRTTEAALDPWMTTGLDVDQRRALAAALGGGITIVSGGPGTGKTSTVVRILAALFERGRQERGTFPRVLLLAPTGKAAVRLSESILAAKERLDAPAAVVAALPDHSSTIHRALGVLPRSRTRFRHGPGEPLDADIVIVDEASMVDLALMRHLLEALPETTSVLLLGDRDQLSSVDAGNVLAELCDALEAGPTSTRGAICELTHSHRFDAGDLTELSSAVRHGDVSRLRQAIPVASESVRLLASGQNDAIVCDLSASAFRSIVGSSNVASALKQLGVFRVLCAHRHGPFGVVGVGGTIQEFLAAQRLIPLGTEYFHGRPILVTETDPVLELMNGDVGLVWHDAAGVPAVHFDRPGRAPLAIAPAHLPGHETAFAMTIHKSQGSEFQHVAVILPPAESPLATRELLYTAITRARRQVTLIGDPVALEVALGREVHRASGLSAAILARLNGEGPAT